MATIKNIIQTIFTSQGAGGTSRDIETLGRAQTRLGQSSASAGRSFAAQSQGLGGLVAAYAGAAATTFALQQGFDKLAKSARALQTIEGLSALAGGIAQDGSAILKSVQDITKGQMTLVESASQINLALSAGFNTKQIEGLAQVSLKASRALGRDLTDAMTRVTRGSAKMETELLDELGIYTKIEPATRAYAAAIGKSVTSLSEFERRQAFANAVIAEGQRKFSSINTSVATSAEKIEAFGARIIDLGLKLGGILADVVAPLADFMTNNLTASFSGFALVVSLIASKAIQVFLGAIDMLRDRALASSRALENKSRILLGIADAAKTATSAIAGLNLATFRGTQAEKNQIASLQDAAKARALTRSELVQSQKLIQKNIASLSDERAAYRQSIREAAVARGKLEQARAMPRGARPGDFSDPAERARNAAIRAANREIAATRPAAVAAVQALPALRSQLNQLETAYAATGAAATGARAQLAAFSGAAIAFGGKLVSNFAAGTGAVLGLVSKIFFFVSIIQLAGSAISSFLGYGDDFNAFFIGVGKNIQEYFGLDKAKTIKNTVNGIVAGSLSNIEKTNKELSQLETFKFKEKKILGIEFSVEKTKEDLVKEAGSILSTVSSGVSDGVQDGLVQGALAGAALGAFVGPIGVAVGAAVGAGLGYFLDSSFNEIEDATSKYGASIKKRLKSELSGFSTEAADNAVQALSVLEERMGRQAMFDPQARAAKEVLESLILQSAQYSDQFATISKIVSATGKQSDAITNQFDFAPVVSSLDYIDSAIIKINETELRLRIADEDSAALQAFFDKYSDNINTVLFQLSDANLKGKLSATNLGLDLSGFDSKDVNNFALAYQEAAKQQENLTVAQFASTVASSESTDLNRVLAASFSNLGDSANSAEVILKSYSASTLPDIQSSILNTIKTTNELNNSLLRSETVLADTFSGINDGSLDVEKFTQNFSNVQDSLVSSIRYVPKAQQELDKLSESLAALDPTSEAAIALSGLIEDEQRRIDVAKENVAAQKELLGVLKEQGDLFKQQAQAADFFKSFKIEKPKNPLSLELDLSLAVKGDLTPLDALTSKLAYLQTFIVDQGADIAKQYNANREALQELALTDAERQRILSTSKEDASSLVAELNKLEGVTASVANGALTITTSVIGIGQAVDGVTTQVVNLQEGAAGSIQQLTENAVQAQKDVIMAAINELPSFIDKAINDYTKLIKDANAEIKKLASDEISLKIKFEMDMASVDAEIAKIQSDARVRKLQFEAEVIGAKKDLKQIDPVAATKQIEAIQQQIITEQQYQLSRQLIADQDALTAKASLIEAEKIAAQDIIRQETAAQIQKLNNDKAYVNGLATLYTEIFGKQQDLDVKSVSDVINAGNAVADSWAKTFESGGKSVATAIISALQDQALVTQPVQGGTATYAATPVDTTISEAVANFNTQVGLAENAIIQLQGERVAAAEVSAQRELELIDKNRQALTEKYQAEFIALEDSRQLQSLNAEKELADAKKSGADAEKKREEQQKKLQEDYKSAIEKTKDALLDLVKEVMSAISSLVLANLQSKVEAAKVNEIIANTNLTATSEKLSEAQTKQQDLMQKELSLRDEVEESYKSLAEVQKSYIESLTGDDRSIKQSGQALIQNILDQKRKQIDLSKTISQRLRQDTFVQSLEDRKLTQEQRLQDATRTRVAAEERLEEVQNILSTITDLLSGQMFKLSSSMQALSQSVAAVQGVVGEGIKLGFSQADMASTITGFGNNVVNSLLFGNSNGGILGNAVNGLVNAGKTLLSAGSNISKAVASTGSLKSLAPTTSLRPMPNPMRAAGGAAGAGAGFWGTVGGAIGGGLQGFGIGNLVGALTKDPGMGSSIGGAIGGALASGLSVAIPSLFASGTFLGGIASGVGTALGVGLNFAIPVVGALVGALIGRLFSKTPKAGATGQLTSEGYTMTSSYQQKVAGGTAKNLSDIAGSTLESVVDSLKAVGIQFKDVVNTSIGLREKSITGASLEFAGGARFEKGGSGTSQEDLKGVAQFYLDSFVKGLRTGSLVVDKTVKGAADLQSAIDKFVKEDQSTKTIERLKEVLDYAAGFSAVLDKLGEAVPVTMGDAINKIVEGSQAAASAVSSQYTELKAQAADVFGTTSAQYAALNKKLKENALSQLGLAKGSDGIIRSVTKANEELNAGTLAIANIIEGITAFDSALVAAGFAASEAANIIDIALNTQLTDFIGAIGEDLKNSIDILKNPAIQSAIELQAIIANAQDRNKQAEGVLAGLKRSEDRISQSTIEKAIDNVAKSVELGALEVERYLESLNIEQLKAVVADEDRIDAATRLAASSRLVALEDEDRATAAKQFIKVSREFNKGLAEITKSSAVPQFVKQATSVIEVAQLLGKNSIDQFSIDFANLVNSIARGENISSNFETAIAGLNGQLSAGTITYTQLVEALDLLQSTALDSIQVLADLVSSVDETTSQIYDLYSTSLDNLITATDEVGSSFSDLLDGFKEKTQSVLGLFDDTLKSVAESGNKLYDLRDNAKEAFDAATKAVAEFEKTNKLTGRTVSQVTAELASVSSQITSLSSKPFDFASFLNLGALSSKQRLLQSELSKLTTVQEEYGKLIADRTAAEQDYLFANKTVSDLEASTTAKLLDTRIKESETVQEVKDAALEFVTSQKDLQDITQLLTAANFNLNQARFEERDRVVQVSEALRDLTAIASNLVAEANSINTTDVNKVKEAAKFAAEIEYGTSATAQITAAVNQAVAEFNSLKAVATSVTSVVNSTVGVGTAFSNAVKTTSDTLKIYDSLLTDSFEGYTKTISGYVTNINAILKSSFDGTDTTNFTGFITNLNKTQDALQLLSPTLNQLLADSKLGVIAGVTQSIGESVGTFQSNIITAVSGLLDAFSPSRKSKVDDFRTALEQFDSVGATINATGGLKDALATARTNAGNLSSSLTTLVANFLSLNTEVAKLNDVTNATTKTVTPGQLSQARAKITEIATALQTAWNNVQFQVNTNLGTGITVRATVDAGSALSANDKGNLKTIATNSRLFPAIGALGAGGYVTGTIPNSATAFAEGGYVKGPGSDTSDSVPAKLSNGEYVIKASSVRRVGKNLLDEINNSGNLGYALSKQGRNGDTLVAHINSDEVRMLLQSGGSGTFNPKTGLMEFFNKDGGAYGGVFANQEVDKLMSSFQSSFTTAPRASLVSPGGFVRMDNASGSPQIYPYNPGEASRLSAYYSPDAIMSQAASAMMLGSRPLEARGLGSLLRISYGIGALSASSANRPFNNIVAQTNTGSLVGVDSNSVGIGPDLGSAPIERGGINARQNQLLDGLARRFGSSGVTTGINSPGLQKGAIKEYIDSLNAKDKGMFFDFYMLNSASARNKGIRTSVFGYSPVGATNSSISSRTTFGPDTYTQEVSTAATSAQGAGSFVGKYVEGLAPTGSRVPDPFAFGGKYAGTISGIGSGILSPSVMFASGGLVTSPRDSVSAMLEPGEFVLRKQAVDRMGLDNAIRLNSTGDAGGDIDIEVNINNNGTSQTTIGTPEVRRENGKIVVDIILEDLRTNGPINRQIRSIR